MSSENEIRNHIRDSKTSLLRTYCRVAENPEKHRDIIESLDITYLEGYYFHILTALQDSPELDNPAQILVLNFDGLISILLSLENGLLKCSAEQIAVLWNIFQVSSLCFTKEEICGFYETVVKTELLTVTHLKIVRILIEAQHDFESCGLPTKILNAIYMQSDLKCPQLENVALDCLNGIVGKSRYKDNLLNKMWNYMKQQRQLEGSLLVLSILLDLFTEHIVRDEYFYEALREGIVASRDLRKQSIYILKTLVDRAQANDLPRVSVDLKCSSWNNFFILLETLNESQSHLILPALNILEPIRKLQKTWFHLVINMILSHENSLVVEWGVKYVLNNLEATCEDVQLVETVLNCFNNVNLFSEEKQIIPGHLKFFQQLSRVMMSTDVIWNSIALYHIVTLLGRIPVTGSDPQHFRNLVQKVRNCINPVIRGELQARLIQIFANIESEFSKEEFFMTIDTILQITGPQINPNETVKRLRVINFDRINANDVINSNMERRSARILLEVIALIPLAYLSPILISRLGLSNPLPDDIFNMNDSDEITAAISLLHFRGCTQELWDLNVEAHETVKSGEVFQQVLKAIKILRDISEYHDTVYSNASIKESHFEVAFQLSFIPLSRERVAKFQARGDQYSEFYQNLSVLMSNVIIHYPSYEPQQVMTQCHILMEIGGPDILVSVMQTVKVIIKFNAIEMILADAKVTIERCYKEVTVNRKNENNWRNLVQFIDLMFVNESIVFHPLWFCFTQTFINELLSEAVQINGLANIIFDRIYNLSADRLIRNWNDFEDVLITGLLYGSSRVSNKRYEMKLCQTICDTFSSSDLKYDVRADQKVRAHSIAFLYKIVSNSDLATHADTFVDALTKKLIAQSLKMGKSKPRYYPDSNHHRTKLRIVQSLAVILKQTRNYEVDLLTTIIEENNQTNVTHLLELIIAETIPTSEIIRIVTNLDAVTSSATAIHSIFTIGFLKSCRDSDLSLAETIISSLFHWTMGQNFTTRLYAQIVILKLIERFNLADQHQIIHQSIQRSLSYGNAEKNAEILLHDFRFDALRYENMLALSNIFHHIPRITGMANEELISFDLINSAADVMHYSLNANENDNALAASSKTFKKTDSLVQDASIFIDDIQKKVIPMKQKLPEFIQPLPDINSCISELADDAGFVVIASLVTRPPNLGGLARTAQIFGVKTYVLDSLRHIENKEFQAVSVTAEKWLKLVELKSHNIADYLLSLKVQGYTIVGAEQTARSRLLQEVQFPKKCALLLGHEKEGIPANLISLLDVAVEIPQFGVVRSLNVHVTGAIFMWEYAKQHFVQ